MRVAPDERDRQDLLLFGQRNGEIGERIEGDGDFGADGASQLRLVLTGEEIDDFRVVALAVDIPSLGRHHLVRPPSPLA